MIEELNARLGAEYQQKFGKEMPYQVGFAHGRVTLPSGQTVGAGGSIELEA